MERLYHESLNQSSFQGPDFVSITDKNNN